MGITAYIQHFSGEQCSQLPKKFECNAHSLQQHIIAMDCKGHYRLWGLAFIPKDRVGEMVKGVLGSEDLLIVIRPYNSATFVNELGFRSWIDVTVVSHPLMGKVKGWGVHANLEIGSNCKFVTFQIQAKLSRGIIFQCPSWSKVNWTHFQADLMAWLHRYS